MKRQILIQSHQFNKIYRCVHCQFTSPCIVVGSGSGEIAIDLLRPFDNVVDRARDAAKQGAAKGAGVALKLCPCPNCGKRDSSEFYLKSALMLIPLALAGIVGIGIFLGMVSAYRTTTADDWKALAVIMLIIMACNYICVAFRVETWNAAVRHVVFPRVAPVGDLDSSEGENSYPEMHRPLVREIVCADSQQSSLDKKMRELVSCATRARFNLLLEKTKELIDSDLVIFVNALRTCKMIADDSGNLLPALFSQIFQTTLVENNNPVQQQRILALLAVTEVDVCVRGRSIRADSLQHLAELVRENDSDIAVEIRQLLANKANPDVYKSLLRLCDSARTFVKNIELKSTYPTEPGIQWWAYQYYDPIAILETLGQNAMADHRATPSSVAS
jgi:hypothetical protein